MGGHFFEGCAIFWVCHFFEGYAIFFGDASFFGGHIDPHCAYFFEKNFFLLDKQLSMVYLENRGESTTPPAAWKFPAKKRGGVP